MLNSNVAQSCSPSKISQSINFERRTSDRTCFQWKREKLWSFEKVSYILIEKNRDIQIEKSDIEISDYIQKSDFRKKGVCSKSVTKTLYRNKFLVSECIFKLVYHCESCRLSEIGGAREISLKHL